ncbi:MAG TPA: N-acetylneuraminate synthase family protein [Cyclobacteriaceae bacterium]|nr:N-acetylneuraminate synthase family protein [Cyclobacteriaceae bacterium]
MSVTQQDRVFIIAEIAQAHEGSLGIAHSYIDALSGTGVDAVKFQTHIAEAESSPYESFRVKFSYEDETRYDYWKRMEFTSTQWAGLKEHCERAGVEFLSSPFSVAAVELLESLEVKRYKIGSGEITNHLLLERIGRTGKPVILSSGMSSFDELTNALEILRPFGNPITILQCTTAYPTKPEQWGLNVIADLRNQFQTPVGFSDHSGEIYACLSAAALGATVLEFHVVFDQQMFGPDAKASLTIEQTRTLVKGVREIESALSNPVRKNDTAGYADLKKMFGKSLAINKALKVGHRIELADLESKKPADQGISAAEFQKVIGKKITRELAAYSFLNYKDLE